MEQLIQAILSLVLLLVLLSVMLTMPTGKLDPFLLLRALLRPIKRIPAKGSKALYASAKKIRRKARGKDWKVSVPLHGIAAFIGLGGFILSIPAAILAETKKR